jgi:hypothetical protein
VAECIARLTDFRHVCSTGLAWVQSNTSASSYANFSRISERLKCRVFHFEVNISAPRLDLGSKSQQILTLALARSIWDFKPLGAKTRTMAVDFSDALDVKHVR